MFSFPSWQTFTSVSLPQNIQRRFVSYFLRKALGHLVKPGQFDSTQIDAQIGSGIVQVTDVEFNHDALNEKLRSAQLPFILESGSLGKITANLPWPNLLTAPVALSLSSLDITLVYSPMTQPSITAGLSVDGISESVNHMAESFVQDELGSTKPFRPSATPEGATYNPPGTFDPVITGDPEITIVDNDEELATPGVSLIATLIERLLSRFKFDMSNMRIKVIFPEKAALIFCLERLTYKTEDVVGRISNTGQGEVRTLSIGNISVSMNALSSSHSPLSASSSVFSDNGDENIALMSQSLAALPPRDHTSSSTVEASLYHSVLSTLPEVGAFSLGHQPEENEEERLVSLGHGTDSICAELTTPSLRTSPDTSSQTDITLALSIFPLLISLNPAQVGILLDVFSLFDKPDPSISAVSKTSSRTMFENWNIKVNFISMNCILLTLPTLSTEQRIINDLHLQYPSPYDLGFPHLRISLDKLDVHVQLLGSRGPQYRFQGYLENISMFSISCDDGGKSFRCPVLISDSNLHPQYDTSPSAEPLPVFNIAERTRTLDVPEALKQSYLRPPQSKQTNSSEPCLSPVLRIQSSASPETTIEFDFIPLHVYVDFGTIKFLNSYIEYISSRKPNSTTLRTRTSHPIPQRNTQMTASTYLEEDSGSGMGFTARFSFIRVEVSTAVPNPPVSKPRSGTLVLDFHQFQVSRGMNSGSKSPVTVLCTLQFKSVIAALALPNVVKAEAFLSIFGSKSADVHILPSVCFRTITSIESSLLSSSSSVDIALPSLTVSLSKALLDGLMYWLDDLSKWNAALSAVSLSDNLPNLGGSKYILRRASSWNSSGQEDPPKKYESVIKLSLDEGKINLLIPRSGENAQAQPLNITLMNTEVLMEISPEGKSETVITLGIKGIDVTDNPRGEKPLPILHLTQPHIEHSTRPLIKLRYTSTIENSLAHKVSKIKLSLSGFTFHLSSDIALVEDFQSYSKSPEGVFETVVPIDRTIISLAIVDGSIEVTGRSSLGTAIFYIGELDFGTVLVDGSPETNLKGHVLSSAALFTDNMQTLLPASTNILDSEVLGILFWKSRGYVSLAEMDDGEIQISLLSLPLVRTEVYINGMKVKLHACADTLSAFTVFMNSITKEILPDIEDAVKPAPVHINPSHTENLMASLDEEAFSRLSGLGPVADMINDDLPTNPDYLDISYGAAGGFREIEEDDLLDFEDESLSKVEGVISSFGGETVRMLHPQGITIVENYFENIIPEVSDADIWSRKSKLRIRADNCDVTFSLYEGYDWLSTRRSIEEEIKLMRRRLVKIKQLLAEGQVPDGSVENTSTLLFNSVSIGLPDDPDDMEPPDLLAAIDKELQYDDDLGDSSWQTLTPPLNNTPQPPRLHNLKLDRSSRSLIDFCLAGIRVEVDSFDATHDLLSKVLICIKNVEILDHVKTSTWKKFLTQLRVDFRGNARETDSDMVRAELRLIRSVPNVSSKEGRFRLKILPIKLNVDQDALDFMKKFFSFQNPSSTDVVSEPQAELYFQHVEVFPVDLKLDYKPKRVDYRALRQGKTIELMNFFHFDGSEITLRHITLSGITGWARLFETLNDLWTPDVKANQLADIISGVSPIRSFVNVGSGVADLVLLPIAQYKKDKRLVRGVQKGTAAFMKNTAMEAVKLGARLATGTQVILEQAETVLGGQGQFRRSITMETVQLPDEGSDGRDVEELISRYADQPQDVREGVQFAYQSLSRNLHSAAQTILAVPMEVYERSGNEGPVRAIVRAVPIAVLKPMIGASEAVSKTLFGLRNSLDPEVRHDNEAKYKHR